MKKIGLSHHQFLQYSRFLIINNKQILTIIDLPDKFENIKETQTYLIIRDLCGKYSWNLFNRLLPINYKPKNNEKEENEENNLINNETKIMDKNETSQDLEKNKEIEIKYDLNYKNDKIFPSNIVENLKRIEKVLTIQNKREQNIQFLEQNITNIDISIKRPLRNQKNNDKQDNEEGKETETEKETEMETEKEKERETETETDKEYNFNNGKMFLSNMGLLNDKNLKKIKLFRTNKHFFKSLKELDQIPERSQYSIGVVYVEEGQNRSTNGDNIFKNEKGNQDYENFLKELGWTINLKTHQGYNGGLNWKKTGCETPYYSNDSIEIIFHTLTMLKNINFQKKKKVIKNDKILIIWCNDKRNFNPKCIKSEKNLIFIIIRPHYTGLNLVSIHDFSAGHYNSSLLIKNSLLGKGLLANLIRISSINILQEIQQNDKNFVHPFLHRQNKIKQITEKFSLSLSNEEFFTHFLTGKIPKFLNNSSKKEKKIKIDERSNQEQENK
ncbi:tuberin [Anaeramoeba flamelloides]|uniref:Tuberin n=1 Tax=Anaeramoeba flamelloides TaxID=1746091 RepID=A0ABQ8YY58_9EUKA|nr:tuberin [Anaeramoeba flamelloides]